MAFLDETGLRYLWGKLKQKFLPLSGGTLTGGLTAGSLTSTGRTSTQTLSVGGSDVADFIVAKGESGSWKYWKWNSGFAVCIHNAVLGDGDENFNHNLNQPTWGELYDLPEYTFSAYPFPFAEIPAVYASRIDTDYDAEYNTKMVWIAMSGGSTTVPPRFDIVRPNYSAIGHPRLSMVAIGRWK